MKRETKKLLKEELPAGINEDPNNIPPCNCGYSRSDYMIDHADECAYLRHGKYHKLEKTYFNPMAD